MDKKREAISEAKRKQAEKNEEIRKKKEEEKRQRKKIESDWMKKGIESKAKINKSLDDNAKKAVSTAKGTAMADSIVHWDGSEKAKDYNQKDYQNWIQSISDIDDPNYDKLVQINSAMNSNKNWMVLRGMIQHLL